MKKFKSIKKISILLFSLLILLNSYVYGQIIEYKSTFGYKVNYNDSKVSIKNENGSDKYFYEEKLGLTITKISNKLVNECVSSKYNEFESSYKDLNYLKNYLPADYKNNNLRGILKETDGYALLEIQLHNGSYYVPFYHVMFYYMSNNDNGVIEISYEYFYEGIESNMYKEMNSIRTSLEILPLNTITPLPSTEVTTNEVSPTIKPTETTTIIPFNTNTPTSATLPETGEKNGTNIFLISGISVIVIGFIIYKFK